ncbi:TolC family protein [Filimonas effusa]|uniref:TolC family protein n=1 Tax=Filimonas effusa TaxID=2508721 RepID=A0A4Q1D7M6_9BACT|nr:TolC family protein [Filimonas effusa]RXK85294.1 TolC family protein [Filimonas effusa]
MKPFFSLLLFFMPAGTAVLKAQDSTLDRYIQEGFAKNLVLQQKSISLAKALYGLQSAKSLYLPTVAFMFDYTTADGGRDIPLPLGDLLNGVYGTLNQLTSSNNFPHLENQQINFLPQNFYDGKVRTSVPIINSDIGYNKKIQEQQVTLQGYEVELYKRELVKSIKTAYYNYLSSLQAIHIYESTLQLAQESRRVNEKLLENGKGLPAYILRATSEVESINAQITGAQQQAENARLYFNSLLNRDAQASIDTSGIDEVKALTEATNGVESREELKSLQQVIGLNETVVKMNRRFNVPKLNGFLDLGSQAQNWKFNGQSRYYMAGLQLSFPIFSGNRNTYKIKQSELDVRNAQLNLSHVKQQLELSINVARNNLTAALHSYQSSLKQLEAASSYFRLIDKGYKAGTNTFIETVDARTHLTSAQLSATINKYKVLIAVTNLERETASYPINNK